MKERRRSAGQSSSGLRWKLLLAAIGLTVAAAGCGGPPEVFLPPTPTPDARPSASPTPTPTPPPPASLVVCLAAEPLSLYLYGDIGRSADLILAAIYDGPIDLLDYAHQPVLLEKIPSLADGDARVERVAIATGDVYLNPETLEPETLRAGSPYLPPGCNSLDCVDTYQGGQVQVLQMTVDFRLLEGLRWSDGEPLTAADSVFSFEVDGHPETPTPKYLYARTYAYRALDERTVEWVGIPGFLDAEYAGNFASPLPEHLLGDLTAAELLESAETARSPLGWGPYQIDEWVAGSHLRMVPNPEYSGASEAVPAFESLVFRFLGAQADTALQQVRTGECDVVDERLIPLDQFDEARAAAARGVLTMLGTKGSVVERIDFNLEPAAGAAGPALVGQAATRKALAACLDRDGLAQELFGELGVVPANFLPPDHPLYDPGETPSPFDPQAANQMLETAGWIGSTGSAGPRRARDIPGLTNGTPLSLTLRTLENPTAERVARWVAEGWADCGVEVEVVLMPPAELFAPWGEGPVFSRDFDAVLWAWPVVASPPCEMFAGWEIPSDQRPLGINAAGFRDGAYDQACRSLLLNPPSAEAYRQAATDLQARFAEELPSIPLYVRPKWAAHVPWLCGIDPNPSAVTVLWNVEELRPCP